MTENIRRMRSANSENVSCQSSAINKNILHAVIKAKLKVV